MDVGESVSVEDEQRSQKSSTPSVHSSLHEEEKINTRRQDDISRRGHLPQWSRDSRIPSMNSKQKSNEDKCYYRDQKDNSTEGDTNLKLQ